MQARDHEWVCGVRQAQWNNTGGIGTPPPDVGTGSYIEKKASFLVEYIQLPEYMYNTVRLGLNLIIVYTIIVIIC